MVPINANTYSIIIEKNVGLSLKEHSAFILE